MKTSKKEKTVRIPISGCSEEVLKPDKKVEKTKFANKSLQFFLERKGPKWCELMKNSNDQNFHSSLYSITAYLLLFGTTLSKICLWWSLCCARKSSWPKIKLKICPLLLPLEATESLRVLFLLLLLSWREGMIKLASNKAEAPMSSSECLLCSILEWVLSSFLMVP